ncbi:galanin receptor type 1 [Biomphalaria pfeifferi]|uniref:Galanin receptor type 1 n=1 Tax=Biomphalaria pfeifferi TaxID=112525 RepID=A0AAD8C925_BIOPF|nr:galanin receptor type 1 [Biomphalaria pfeifferi]
MGLPGLTPLSLVSTLAILTNTIWDICATAGHDGTESSKYSTNTTTVEVILCADINVGASDQKAYAIWKLVSLFAIPTFIVLFCYIRVICILWLSTRQLQTMTSHTTRFGTARLEQNHIVSLRNGSPQSRLRSSPSLRAGEEALVARKQVIKMLVIIIVVFLISWGPKLFIQVLKKFQVHFLYQPSAYNAFLVINCLPYFQSCINPLIYVLMSKNIRGSIRKLATTVCACKCCARERWADSPSHELIQTNHSLMAGHTYDTYPSCGTKSVSHV